MTTKPLSQTAACAAKCLYAAMKYLKEVGTGMPVREIVKYIEENVGLTDWEKEIAGKYQNVRWVTDFHFYSVDYQKAGFIEKDGGLWYLTPAGEDALKLSPEEVLRMAGEAYRKWAAEHKKDVQNEESLADDNSAPLSFEDLRSQALSEIKDYIQKKLTPEEFQEVVAALLRAMGYYTPFVASKGKDGGVDVIAYSDPLGLKEPRIKVQVKRYSDDNKVSAPEVRGLLGILTPKESALFVTSGYYSPDAKAAAKDKNICLLDGNEFINLWQEFYPKMTDEDKDRLPLKYVALLDKEE